MAKQTQVSRIEAAWATVACVVVMTALRRRVDQSVALVCCT
jgi:hypothetical protein